VCKDRSST
jgi:hypothetical protein